MPIKSDNLTDPIFSGGGAMGVLMRAFDWSQTPIGPVPNWPQSLRTAVRIILTSRYAMFIWWGRELVNLYNDPYREFLGIKHPAALGKSAREVWAEIWDQIGPRTDAVLLRGESTFDQALLLLMGRHGYLEETYFTFSYSPLPDDAGGIGGLFCAVTEETDQVIGERRLRLLRKIAAATAECRTPVQVCESAARCLSSARRDLPFSLFYLLDADGETLNRVAAAGIDDTHGAAPARAGLGEDSASPWPFREVMDTGNAVLLDDLAQHFSALPTGEWNHPPRRAILQPIAQQGQKRPAGVFVAGLNPHREFADDFKGFLTLLSNCPAGAEATGRSFRGGIEPAPRVR
ncbi:MAG TPA: GAF domain-containing protein [Terriglobales bacterium]|nr:GAF domain-containing protein [Terriglobales bacterium]